jgi:adenine-specific DNA-methyltransferase
MESADAVETAICHSVAVSTINDTERQRKDYGDVAALAASIKQFGIIQPIVLYRAASGETVLITGGRRLAALRSLGVQELKHGRDFIWREEIDSADGRMRLQAVELEENLRRKELHWSEHIAAKARLFDLMQSIHGVGKGFGAGRTGVNDGFSLRRLAAMLGENHSVTSRDLELASFVAKHPMLATLPTKADAVRKLGVAVTVAAMQNLAKKSVVAPQANKSLSEASSGVASTDGASVEKQSIDASALAPQHDERWVLYEGRFQDNIASVADESVDLVCTDLPYNIGLGDSAAAHSAGLGQFDDSELDIAQLCADVAVESFRVMRNNRFGVFFYGMNYHQVLYDALVTAGFTVDVYPFIWLRDRSAPPDGFARYRKTYDPALIASKGVPRFVRPNLPNLLAIPSVRGPERIHAAQKPVGIMQKFIEDMTVEGCVVLDMFAGAGTTGVAALRTKRKAILFELEPANCVLIRSQLGAIKAS